MPEPIDYSFLDALTNTPDSNVVRVNTELSTNLLITNYCAECWPEKKSAVSILCGNSLCENCMNTKKRVVDETDSRVPTVSSRDPHAVWGKLKGSKDEMLKRRFNR